ncbi:hypothetical protein DFH07DRAFT_738600, partial [Mycena maculata]
FVFPAIASTGQLKIGECTSRSGFESFLDDVVERSGVMKGRNGQLTTHCFGRGGARYRFLWAERKLSLKAVKWWGGWSSNENVSLVSYFPQPSLPDARCTYRLGLLCGICSTSSWHMRRASLIS